MTCSRPEGTSVWSIWEGFVKSKAECFGPGMKDGMDDGWWKWWDEVDRRHKSHLAELNAVFTVASPELILQSVIANNLITLSRFQPRVMRERFVESAGWSGYGADTPVPGWLRMSGNLLGDWQAVMRFSRWTTNDSVSEPRFSCHSFNLRSLRSGAVLTGLDPVRSVDLTFYRAIKSPAFSHQSINHFVSD